MRQTLTLLLSLAISATVSSQCSITEIPLSQRALSSDLVIEGKVVAQSSFWNLEHTMIYTSSTVEVYKIFRGTVSTGSIEVITEGGTVNYDRITVDPSLILHPGNIGVFTCEEPHHIKGTLPSSYYPVFEPYGSVQGFVKYDIKTATASDPFRSYSDVETEIYAVVGNAHHFTSVQNFDIHSAQHNWNPNAQAPSITSFAPSTVTAGVGTTITITGSGFGATQGSGTVGFKNADDGGATYINPLASQYVSWSNTSITVQVPAGAGTGTIQVSQGSTATSASTLTVSWANLNVEFDPGSGTIAYETDHIDDNGSGGYTWRMNTGFDGNASARAAFMSAFDTWRCNTGINWTIGATTSINDAVSDGTNIICFDNTAPLSAGILGVCYSYWSGCASGPTIIWFVNELDIIFDEGSNISPLTWNYGPGAPTGSQYDFQSVAVHELGHGHQLGHVINPGAIMHYALSNGAQNITPSSDDLAAANYVQSKSIVANVCGPGAMTNYTCSSAPVANFSGTPTTVCPGGSVAFTDLSTNTPTSWSWTFPGGTPGTSTSQNPSITYNTPGTYNVSLTATNAAGSGTVTMTGYITVAANPTVTISSQTNVSCNGGSNGSATATVNGGTPSYSYNWTPGNPAGDGTATVTGLTSGSWTITVTDANGCTGSNAATITQPTAISTSGSSTPSSCSGSTGTATVTASGGAGGYSYSWSPSGGTASTATNLAAGNYTCTVTDANTCTATQTVTVGTTSSPTLTLVSETDPSCAGGSDGSALVSASGGTPGYTYSWFPSGGTAPLETGLSSGAYICTVTDAATCTASVIVTVGSPAIVGGSVSSQTNVSCNGGSNGSVTISASGGTPGYTYSWSPSGGTSATASGLAAGNYTCTITDSHSCTGTVTVAITQPSALIVTASGTASICSGNSTSISASSSGGTGSVTYNWMPGSLSGSSVSVTPASTTTYTVTGTDANGCTATSNVTVTVVTCGSSQLSAAYCGSTISSFTQVLTYTASPGATNYRIRCSNASLGYSYVYTRGSNLTTFKMIIFPNLRYSTTYSVDIAVYVGGVWGSYGPACNVTTPPLPVPQLIGASCGATGVTNSTNINYTDVAYATNYKIRVTNASLGYSQVVTRGNATPFFRLSSFTGILINTTYNVEISAYVTGVWGSYGTICTVTTGAALRLANESETDDPSIINYVDAGTPSIAIYPNPSENGNVHCTLSGFGVEQGNVQIELYDMLGNRIDTQQLEYYSDIEFEFQPQVAIAKGMYLMKVNSNGHQQYVRMIVE